jgi:hypothetical protein
MRCVSRKTNKRGPTTAASPRVAGADAPAGGPEKVRFHDPRIEIANRGFRRQAQLGCPFRLWNVSKQALARCRDISPSVTWSIASDLLWLLTGEDVKPDTVRNRLART